MIIRQNGKDYIEIDYIQGVKRRNGCYELDMPKIKCSSISHAMELTQKIQELVYDYSKKLIK